MKLGIVIVLIFILVLNIVYMISGKDKDGFSKLKDNISKEKIMRDVNRFRKSVVGWILIIVLCGSMFINISTIKESNNYEDRLAYTVSRNIQKFTGRCSNKEIGQDLHTQLYSYIRSAYEASVILPREIVLKEAYERDLSMLLLEIDMLMQNDMSKFKTIFQKDEIIELLFDISSNLLDEVSINKVMQELKSL